MIRGLAGLFLLLLVYWLSATAVVHVFMEKRALWEGWQHQEYAFERFLDRTAARPFVYRALTPWMVNLIDDGLPQAVRERYAPTARAVVDRYTENTDPAYWTPELERKYLITFVLMALFGFAALLALRSLVGAVFPAQPALRDAAPLLFGTLLPLSFMNGGYLYDFPELFFSFAVFACAWRRRWFAMWVLFGLGVLNKETAALAALPLSVVLRHREPRAVWIRHSTALFGIAFVLVVYLRLAYGDRAGSTMYDHVAENFAFWTTPRSWMLWMNVFTPVLAAPRGLNLVMIVPLVVVLVIGWRQRDLVLTRMLAISSAINLPLFFLFCWKDETRNLSLMYPSLCLNVCAAAVAAYRTEAR